MTRLGTAVVPRSSQPILSEGAIMSQATESKVEFFSEPERISLEGMSRERFHDVFRPYVHLLVRGKERLVVAATIHDDVEAMFEEYLAKYPEDKARLDLMEWAGPAAIAQLATSNDLAR